MGVCLCKDKVNDANSDDLSPYTITSRERLSERVDELVKETLDVIASIVDDEPEAPNSMLLLHDITDHHGGWITMVKSLIRVIPVEHPLGPSVITLLLDDSPLPSKDSVIEVAEMVKLSGSSIPFSDRNFCVILGCLAEKLAGPSSIAILTETTLTYLLKNITTETSDKDVMLFSLIALEKFAQTAENKSTIKRKLSAYDEHPLLKLEKQYSNFEDFLMRQIGFCAQWSLDNYFLIEERDFTYESADLENINVMLNTKDVSEYLKISADGLEARCDSYSFESVRSTFHVSSGSWYFETLIITSGVMQIGFAQKESHFMSNDGYGIGDDAFSVSFDGCRKLIWHNAKSRPINLPSWKSGSICGCFIDLDKQEIIFSLDGVEEIVVLKDVFADLNRGFFPAASFMSFQQCRFNFGSEAFKYPPKRDFSVFNDEATLHPQDKTVLPKHIFLEALREQQTPENSCQLCFDSIAKIILIPCKHTGFCFKCSEQLKCCPICRADIAEILQDTSNVLVES